MFTLTDDLNDTVSINGKEYKVDMSFDNIMVLNEMLNDNALDQATQIITGFQMLLGELPDIEIKDATTVFLEVYKSLIGTGEDDEIQLDRLGNPLPVQKNDKSEQHYDLKQDAEYIYASFLKDYNIDLLKERGKMHWYTFKALLGSLSDDTKFKKVMEIRQMDMPKGTGSDAMKHREAVAELRKFIN